MAQATLNRVLEDIRNMELTELSFVERAVQERLETAGYSPDEWSALQALLQAGLLTEIKPKRVNTAGERRLIRVEGKPISETIVEERR